MQRSIITIILALGITAHATDEEIMRVEENEVIPIGSVQGPVLDRHNPQKHKSPMKGDYATVQGVIYEKSLRHSRSGKPLYGFFMQNTAETADGKPETSDGLYVFTGPNPETGGPEGLYEPKVGDEIVIRGKIGEYLKQTEMSHAIVLRVVQKGVDLDAHVKPFDADPPADLDEAARYWERRECMRTRVPAGAIAQGGRYVYASTQDGELWVIRGDSVTGSREQPFERRVFRDAHPLDDMPESRSDNRNGYRILLGSHGIKAAANDHKALIKRAHTFALLAEDAVGAVHHAFGKYSVQVDRQIELASDADPARNHPPQRAAENPPLSIATYNIHNLYDFRDDPFDDCDFHDDIGCKGVKKPFNYVPHDEDTYRQQLRSLASTIVRDLHAPDILLLQEAEDQDIGTAQGDVLVEGTQDHADGAPDVVQELAMEIAALGGPAYRGACDRDGADGRGIISPFLYRSDRVELIAVDAEHPIFGEKPSIPYRAANHPMIHDVQNPKAFNAELPGDVDVSTGKSGTHVFSRGPQVGWFRFKSNDDSSEDVYVINNHFSSGPNRRVGQRKEQAAYNALLTQAIRAHDPDARIVVGGDLNVFPRPDDPYGDDPSDQLAPLYDAGLANLYDQIESKTPSSAYTTVYRGEAGTLDQLFVTPNLLSSLRWVSIAHINSDWSRHDPAASGRGVSDHDPVVAQFGF